MAIATSSLAFVATDRPRQTRPISANVIWGDLGIAEIPAWKTSAYSKIAALRGGKKVPGLGDLRPSDQAVLRLRKLLHDLQIKSLPFPAVAPMSGGAVLISWKSGARCVEATAYNDGEVLIEGLENQNPNEEISEGDLASVLNWLIQR
jgi:hypothetical protein